MPIAGKLLGDLAKRRYFPLVLALGAVLLMLPALWTGLSLDDLVQRVQQFPPEQLPPGLEDTGFFSSDSGKLGTVLCDLFGFRRGEEAAARAIHYGTLTWWMPEGLKAALFRPLTAFTHWLDYRLFPGSPALMHAHNIAWFAAVVFLAAVVYREIGATALHPPLGESRRAFAAGQGAASFLDRAVTADSAGADGFGRKYGPLAAGLAAFLFLLDKNTYFPVAYVANRGFIVSLFFGLLCFREHYQWRATGSRKRMWFSAGFLLLSLLANEGGASTLAFLLAYVLVLERAGWRERVISLLPATLVVCVWRVVYVSAGFGVRSLGGYVDPGYEPLYFVRQLAVRVNALLGGQLSGVPPEVSLLFSPGWQAVFPLFFASFNLACAVVLLPLLRRDAVARFWAVVMILALVPAATVAPLSKNLAFVSVGAFGMLAGLLLRFARREERAALGRPLRVLSWGLVLWLVVAHVPGALVGRALMARVGPLVPRVVAHWCSFSEIPNFGGHDVVVVNNALLLSTLAAPFYRAYYGQPLPRSLNSLAPGCTRLTATRPDDRTLVLTATDADLFQCDPVGPFHFCYGLQAAVDFIAGGRRWTAGERLARNGYGVEVQQVSPAGLPSKVAFRFNRPLESANLVWVFFDWQRLRYSPFTPPRVGESCEIDGPRPL